MQLGLDFRFIGVRIVLRLARYFLKLAAIRGLMIQHVDLDIMARESRRVWKSLCRTREIGAVSDLTLAEWFLLLRLYGCRCAFCGVVCRSGDMTIEHLTSVSQGGGTTLYNVVPSCKACNARRAHWSRNGQGIL